MAAGQSGTLQDFDQLTTSHMHTTKRMFGIEAASRAC